MGTLLLQDAMVQPEEAEACLQQALDVSRRQEAKALELRAAMSLARLWRQQGKLTEAHARYGQRNISDVIEYSGIHDALHGEQIGRVTRSPGYPAPSQTAATR